MELDKYSQNEIQHHKAFCERNNIRWTPTIILNGHIVPEIYTIEDIAYTLFE